MKSIKSIKTNNESEGFKHEEKSKKEDLTRKKGRREKIEMLGL